MKNIHLIICLFSFSFAATAQSQSIDSLKKVLRTASQDTVKINILNHISTAFIQTGHFDSAYRYTKPSINLVEKSHYQVGAVVAFQNLALYNFHIKEYKTGKFFLLKSLNAALITNDKKNIAANYKELADLYQLQSNFKLAKESNRKYKLYSDSLANEESYKPLAKIDTVASVKEKEEVKLATNNNDTKAVAVNEIQQNQILYILIFVLLVLSLIIIWFFVNRKKTKAKRNAVLSEENALTGQDKTFEKLIQSKDSEIDKAAFLQKNPKVEALVANNNTDNKKAPAEVVVPILTVDEKEFIEGKTVVKADINENIVSNEKEKIILKPAIETAAFKIETESDTKEALIEQTTNAAENKVSNFDEQTEKPTVATVDRRYSNLIFADQLPHVTAKFLGDAIKLVWKTGDEKNMVQFAVEKSSDGVQFVSIEAVAAKGFDGNIYETVDFKPLPGTNYYRLEVVDTKGDFIYSPTVQVDVLPVSTLTLICYPTYVKDVIIVTAAGGKLPVSVNIFNKAGKKEFSIETPPTTTPIYLTSLAAGTYTLQMKCQGKTILQQLIKM